MGEQIIIWSLVLTPEYPGQAFKNLIVKLFSYIENYPSMSRMVEMSLRQIIDQIKQIKKSGEEYSDIADHPMVKRYLDKLEDFI